MVKPVTSKLTNNTYTGLLTPQNSQIGPGFLLLNSPNPDVTWESMKQTNFGIDFTLFDSRFSASFDWYKKESKGFLI